MIAKITNFCRTTALKFTVGDNLVELTPGSSYADVFTKKEWAAASKVRADALAAELTADAELRDAVVAADDAWVADRLAEVAAAETK